MANQPPVSVRIESLPESTSISITIPHYQDGKRPPYLNHNNAAALISAAFDMAFEAESSEIVKALRRSLILRLMNDCGEDALEKPFDLALLSFVCDWVSFVGFDSPFFAIHSLQSLQALIPEYLEYMKEVRQREENEEEEPQ
jgi:hypothetical protein